MPLKKRDIPPWTVVGVDNGSRLAAVVSPGGSMTRARLHSTKLTQHAPPRRCFQAGEWMHLVVAQAQEFGYPVHVFIESPFISGRTMSSAIPLSRLQGALMAGAYGAGAEAVYDVAPSQWKLALMGKGYGNADKDYITSWMLVHWPWLHTTAMITMPKDMVQDAIDAGGVMLYGSDVLRRAAHLTEENS